MKKNRKKDVRKVNLREYIDEQTKTGAQNEVSMDEKIGRLLDAELLKSADEMDMDLIREGLNYFYPFDEEADRAAAEESYQRFLEKYDPFGDRKKKRITPRRIIVVAAALVVLLVTGVCYALGVNLWKVAYEWVQDSLFLKIEYNGEQDMERANPTYATEIWGEALYDLMEENGISVNLPTWMPEELTLEHVNVIEEENVRTFIDTEYSTVNGSVLLTISRDAVAKDGMLPYYYVEAEWETGTKIIINDITYYVAKNFDKTFILWEDGQNVIWLTGVFNEDSVHKIITSM